MSIKPRFTIALLALPLLLSSFFASTATAQEQPVERTAYPRIHYVEKPDSLLTSREIKTKLRREHRDSVRANKAIWTSILGGPSYTPDASLGVAGAVLMSFKTNPQDTVSQRSFLPVGFNMTINGTIVVAGAGTFFFNEDKYRLYTNYGFRNEPSNFYGVGMDQISATERGELTEYDKRNIYLLSKFQFNVGHNIYLGPTLDMSYSKIMDVNDHMNQDAYVNQFDRSYLNVGLGGYIQYDTRDDVATPSSGKLLSATAKIFGRYVGGDYNYQLFDLEYRQFKYLFGRSVLGWTARAQMSSGDVPFTELPTWGSPFDLRGFYWGEYRDKSAGYGIVEYRQMLGSQEAYKQGKTISKFGYVVWAGLGTLGQDITKWNETRYNYGVGLRAQIQPRKNFRLDIGKGQGEDGMFVYFNMTEAF